MNAYFLQFSRFADAFHASKQQTNIIVIGSLLKPLIECRNHVALHLFINRVDFFLQCVYFCFCTMCKISEYYISYLYTHRVLTQTSKTNDTVCFYFVNRLMDVIGMSWYIHSGNADFICEILTNRD